MVWREGGGVGADILWSATFFISLTLHNHFASPDDVTKPDVLGTSTAVPGGHMYTR